MSRALRPATLALLAGAFFTACSDQAPLTAPGSAHFAKSGTAPSGGGSGGGGSTTPSDTSTGSTPTTSPTGEPVGPTYIGVITTMGVVPAGFYYGVPSGWKVNGYAFSSVYTTNYKPVNGPIVLGACVTINFAMSGTARVMQEMKTLDKSKCQ